MNNTFTMDKLEVGQSAAVIKINTAGDMRRRFIDLGLIEGTIVNCVGKSPAGDPKAFLIKGAVIAIRKEDSQTITLKILENWLEVRLWKLKIFPT